jgi:hypothetical protein
LRKHESDLLLECTSMAAAAAARLSMATDCRTQAALQMAERAMMRSPSAFADATGLAGVAREAELAAAMKRAVCGPELAAQAMRAASQDRLFAPHMRASSSAWQREKSAHWPTSALMADAFARTADYASLAASALVTEPSFVSVAAEESRRTAAARAVEGIEQRMAAEFASLNAGPRRQEQLKPPVVKLTVGPEWKPFERDELAAKLKVSRNLLPCDCNPCELSVSKTESETNRGGYSPMVKFKCDACGSSKEIVRWSTLKSAGRGPRLVSECADDEDPED